MNVPQKEKATLLFCLQVCTPDKRALYWVLRTVPLGAVLLMGLAAAVGYFLLRGSFTRYANAWAKARGPPGECNNWFQESADKASALSA